MHKIFNSSCESKIGAIYLQRQPITTDICYSVTVQCNMTIINVHQTIIIFSASNIFIKCNTRKTFKRIITQTHTKLIMPSFKGGGVQIKVIVVLIVVLTLIPSTYVSIILANVTNSKRIPAYLLVSDHIAPLLPEY